MISKVNDRTPFMYEWPPPKDSPHKHTPHCLVYMLQVPSEFLVKAQKARLFVTDILDDPRINSFSKVSQKMMGKAGNTLQLDKTFKLELHALQHVEAMVVQLTKQKALEVFPTQDKDVSLTTTSNKLSVLRSSAMVEKSTEAAQNIVESAQSMVKNMSMGVSPKNDSACDEFFQNLLNRAQYFFRWKNEEDNEVLVARTGLKTHVNAIFSKSKKGPEERLA